MNRGFGISNSKVQNLGINRRESIRILVQFPVKKLSESRGFIDEEEEEEEEEETLGEIEKKWIAMGEERTCFLVEHVFLLRSYDVVRRFLSSLWGMERKVVLSSRWRELHVNDVSN
uniref:Uncharacterized protein n=1 Tax=Cucumis melo TaxID=3656 RepID=A0A9I9EC56_CUCME